MVRALSRPPGLALIQVDGLSKRHLEEAFDKGLMPHFKERVDNGTLKLDHYRCGLPSQTTVSIAGMLYGEMLPGNQWFDKESQSVVDTFSLGDAHDVATDLARRKEGLAKDGGSVYLSPLDGESSPKDSLFVFSDMGAVQKAEGRRGMIRNSLAEFSVLARQLALHPLKAIQSAVNFAGEIAHELKNRKATGRKLKTILKDAFKDTILPDAASLRIAEQLKKAEAPFVYVDLANFDAKSHPYGPGQEAFATLPGIDKNLDVILDAAEKAGTEVAIVADHGSAHAYHFHHIYGESLQDLAGRLSGRDDVLSLDFGSGAHLYLTSESGELQRGEVPPVLLKGLREHPGVAFTVTRQSGRTLIESDQGRIVVTDDDVRLTGEDPIKSFEEDTEQVAQELHSLAHRGKVGDVIVFGERYKDGLIDFSTGGFKGLHGGIGFQQTEPFVAWSDGLGLRPQDMTSAADLYEQLKGLN